MVRPSSGGWDVEDDAGRLLLHALPEERHASHEAEKIAGKGGCESKVVGSDGSTWEIRQYPAASGL